MSRQPYILRAALVVLALAPLDADKGSAPGEALARLREGNSRFSADVSESRVINASRRAALARGQAPFATVLSCADSRVPPEIIFNTGLGDLFVVRVAGEVADRAVLASVEYAVQQLQTPLVLVMGHEFCGAVTAAAAPPAGSRGPNLDFLLSAIRPAVARAQARPEADALRAAILSNVEEVMNALVSRSDIIRTEVASRNVQVIGGYYELASGRVHFSSPVDPREVATVSRRPSGR
jgi:carbonic anhydrase